MVINFSNPVVIFFYRIFDDIDTRLEADKR